MSEKKSNERPNFDKLKSLVADENINDEFLRLTVYLIPVGIQYVSLLNH